MSFVAQPPFGFIDPRQLGSKLSKSSKSSKGSKSSKSSKSSKGTSAARAQFDALPSEFDKDDQLKTASRKEYGPDDGVPHDTDPIIAGASAIESKSKAPAIAVPLAGVALVAVAALYAYKRAKKNRAKAEQVLANDVGDDFTEEQVLSNDVDSTDSIDVDSTHDLA